MKCIYTYIHIYIYVYSIFISIFELLIYLFLRGAIWMSGVKTCGRRRVKPHDSLSCGYARGHAEIAKTKQVRPIKVLHAGMPGRTCNPQRHTALLSRL